MAGVFVANGIGRTGRIAFRLDTAVTLPIGKSGAMSTRLAIIIGEAGLGAKPVVAGARVAFGAVGAGLTYFQISCAFTRTAS